MSILSGRIRPFLPDRDYLPMAMPTTAIDVLQVLASGGREILRRHTSLDRMLVSTIEAPDVTRDAIVVDASGSVTRSTKIGIGLGVVGQILRAFGADANLNIQASGAQAVEYAYADVTADSVDLAELDRWLSTSDLDPGARATAELVAAEKMYVVVNVLKARALTVRLVDARTTGIALDAPLLQQAVGAKVDVALTGGADGTLTFHGSVPLGVAVKATPIIMDEHGLYLGNGPRTRGEVRPLGQRRTWLTGSSLRLESP